jgi:transcriptional regulator with XRE-family HTH domain
MSSQRHPSPGAIPIAYEVHRRMVDLGLSQKALAVRAGLGPSYVADLFAGKSRNPKNEQLEKLAKALGCEVADLTHPQRAASNDPERHDGVDASSILPLYPSELPLLRLWRVLSRDARDQLLLRAIELLPHSIKRRKNSDE